MKMKICPLFFAILTLAVGPPALGQSAPHEDSIRAEPLKPFEPLIGGRWVLGSSFHEFDWGVGRTSVHSRAYTVVDGKPKLVSQGMWFWHAGRKAIRGFATAVDMPVVLFDYTTRFEGSTMVSDLLAYAPDGTETVYLETWEFESDSSYVWRLLDPAASGLREIMRGKYVRE
jgi:hypothetical protein